MFRSSWRSPAAALQTGHNDSSDRYDIVDETDLRNSRFGPLAQW
jgi:hypothetical protein